jgi:hypothetical protein
MSHAGMADDVLSYHAEGPKAIATIIATTPAVGEEFDRRYATLGPSLLLGLELTTGVVNGKVCRKGELSVGAEVGWEDAVAGTW